MSTYNLLNLRSTIHSFGVSRETQWYRPLLTEFSTNKCTCSYTAIFQSDWPLKAFYTTAIIFNSHKHRNIHTSSGTDTGNYLGCSVLPSKIQHVDCKDWGSNLHLTPHSPWSSARSLFKHIYRSTKGFIDSMFTYQIHCVKHLNFSYCSTAWVAKITVVIADGEGAQSCRNIGRNTVIYKWKLNKV